VNCPLSGTSRRARPGRRQHHHEQEGQPAPATLPSTAVAAPQRAGLSRRFVQRDRGRVVARRMRPITVREPSRTSETQRWPVTQAVAAGPAESPHSPHAFARLRPADAACPGGVAVTSRVSSGSSAIAALQCQFELRIVPVLKKTNMTRATGCRKMASRGVLREQTRASKYGGDASLRSRLPRVAGTSRW
jgi:hypothetical protein